MPHPLVTVTRLQLKCCPERAILLVWGALGVLWWGGFCSCQSICSACGEQQQEAHFCLSGHFVDGKVEAQGRKKPHRLTLPDSELFSMDCVPPLPGEGPKDQGGYSLGRAVHRSPPASLGYRRRSRQKGCRLPRWHRHKSHCSSGPMSHWDMAGSSPGPATLGRGQKVSPSHAQRRQEPCRHSCLDRPP